jgi:Tol biopolymer transport system component
MPTHRKTFKNGGVMIALACGALVAWGEPLSLISWRDVSQAPPTPGNGDSWAPILTPDGRYVAFASTADNLVTVNGTNSLPNYLSQKQNVFLRDRSNGFTTLVSVNLAGTGGGDGDSLPTAISGDGHYVLFESLADNLVPGDTNGWADVFLRDVWSNRTVLISVSTNGGAGNGVSRESTLTPDGRYVAFTSAASNLVALDTNGLPDVFVRDWQNGITTLASVGALPASADNLIGSESPELSDDGRYVVFYSTATNLVAGVTNSGEIYIRDLVAGTTTWASAGAHEFLGATTVSFNHALSTNGNFVAYEACTNPPIASGVYQGIVLRFSRTSGLTDIVSTNAYAPTANLEDFHDLSLTPDGRFIAFIANTNAGSTPRCFSGTLSPDLARW